LLRKVLGQDLMRAVLAVDPMAPPPEVPPRAADLNIVPDFLKGQLTSAKQEEAPGAG
jgi:hypothetical protein